MNWAMTRKSLLIIAAYNENIETAVTLIEHGADCSVLEGHAMKEDQEIIELDSTPVLAR